LFEGAMDYRYPRFGLLFIVQVALFLVFEAIILFVLIKGL
jgi:hypothetical protein